MGTAICIRPGAGIPVQSHGVTRIPWQASASPTSKRPHLHQRPVGGAGAVQQVIEGVEEEGGGGGSANPVLQVGYCLGGVEGVQGIAVQPPALCAGA